MVAGDLLKVLRDFELLTADTVSACAKLRRSGERRALQLAQPFDGSIGAIETLAAAFSLGEPGAPAVPYARLP